MLAVVKIREAMKRLGLTQAALAHKCGVSPEAVSNWLKGESLPRPAALLKLAEATELSLESLAEEGLVAAEPVVAFRTRRNRKPSESMLAAAVSMGEHLRELIPYLDAEFRIFAPAALTDPKCDEEYVRAAALRLRKGLGVEDGASLSVEQLLLLHRQAGSLLLPVLWGGGKVGHENALSVFLPDSRASWVVFNLNCKIDDFKYWLAHELGHCYSLHALRDKAGEEFSELFAKALLCPDAIEEECWRAYAGAGRKADAVFAMAEKYEISALTIAHGIDRYAKRVRKEGTGLFPEFYSIWSGTREGVKSVAQCLMRSDAPEAADYVRTSEQKFGSPAFRALARWIRENGKSANFVSTCLNINVPDARALADYLVGHGTGGSSPKSVR